LEQVSGDAPADVVDAGFLRCDALGFFEGVECFTDLPSHGVRLC